MSKRADKLRAIDALSLLQDVVHLTAITVDDFSRLKARCEDDIADEAVRAVASRRAYRMGKMLRDVDELVADAKLSTSYEEEWKAFLSSKKVPGSAFMKRVEALNKTLTKRRDELAVLEPEEEDDASSLSDYSETSSSSSSSSSSRSSSDDEEDVKSCSSGEDSPIPKIGGRRPRGSSSS